MVIRRSEGKISGGEMGIRTPGTLVAHTRFPIVLLQPDSDISPSQFTDWHGKPVRNRSIYQLNTHSQENSNYPGRLRAEAH